MTPATPVVVFTANDRPWCMTRVLDTWRNVRGIGAAHMIFQCEPHDDMIDLISEQARFAGETEIRINGRQAGCEANTGIALAAGFETGADFVVLGEDDGTVTSDLLEYMTWAAGRYQDDGDVFAVCTFQDAPPGPPDEVRRTDWFFPPVWGIWRDRWEALKDGWPQGHYEGRSWDWWMITRMRAAGQHVIQSMATRSQQIGEYGTYQRGSLQDVWDKQQFTADVPVQDGYRELPGLWTSQGVPLR